MSDFVIITGMSGAGRSTAAATLEDLGWFVIDNLPVSLISKVAELVEAPGSETERIALVVGRAGSEHLGDHKEDLPPALENLRKTTGRVRVIFLEASDEVLVRRFEGTRRRHPLSGEGVAESIEQERFRLKWLKDAADIVIDTSDLNTHQLKERLVEIFEQSGDHNGMQTSIMSFGFKHGIPLDADLVFDGRFLPNPHWVEALRPMTGLEQGVRDYVLSQPDSLVFLDKLEDLLSFLLPSYIKEGKSYLTIALGCTGGKHRSVVLVEELSQRIQKKGFELKVNHRDINR